MPPTPWKATETVAPREALARWRFHRDRFGQTGLWPVIVPPDDESAILKMFEVNAEAPTEIPVAAEVLSRRLEKMRAEEEEYEDDEFEPMDLDFDPSALERGVASPIEAQIAVLDDAKGDLSIALLPLREAWEAPLVRRFGNWNDCPTPAEHAAILRDWHARHGAEPLVMGHDILELLVRPIEDREEAKRVAVEQYAYCPDIVDQGIGSVEALAASLLGASVWFFWWD